MAAFGLSGKLLYHRKHVLAMLAEKDATIAALTAQRDAALGVIRGTHHALGAWFDARYAAAPIAPPEAATQVPTSDAS